MKDSRIKSLSYIRLLSTFCHLAPPKKKNLSPCQEGYLLEHWEPYPCIAHALRPLFRSIPEKIHGGGVIVNCGISGSWG